MSLPTAPLDDVDAARHRSRSPKKQTAVKIFDADEFITFSITAVGDPGIWRGPTPAGTRSGPRCRWMHRAQDPVPVLSATAAPQGVVAGLGPIGRPSSPPPLRVSLPPPPGKILVAVVADEESLFEEPAQCSMSVSMSPWASPPSSKHPLIRLDDSRPLHK